MNAYELLRTVTLALLVLNGMKSVIGFHFPWEKCECCGKPWKEHSLKTPKKNKKLTILENKLDQHRVNIQYPEPGKHHCKYLRVGKFDVTYDPDKLHYLVFRHQEDGEDTRRYYVKSDILSMTTARYLQGENK